jgi:hypothetical protein
MKMDGLATGILAALLLAASVPARPAEAADKHVKYVAPEGFGGHKWGELRTSFERLPADPIGVGAAWMQPKEKQTDVTCVPISAPGPTMSGAPEGCDFQATLLRYRKTFEGGGTYVLSEYSIDGQGFRFGDETTGVVLHPVVYQFCANWGQTRKTELPPNFDSINKFCGMKFVFQSESREQLRKLSDEHETTYDRLLEKLIDKYGRPEASRAAARWSSKPWKATDRRRRSQVRHLALVSGAQWIAHGLHRQRGVVARSGHRQGNGAVLVATAVGVRLCARKLRLQG